MEILTGADTDKVRKWGHHQLSTYGIGKDMKRTEWQSIGRELIRLGFVNQSTEKFSTLELTPEGREVLRTRKPITLTKPVHVPEPRAHSAGEIACDETLFERLRVLRSKLAEERGVPPYIIFGDVSLRQMARNYPTNDHEFTRISGVGEKKRIEFGEKFLGEIADYLRTYPKQIFADDSFQSEPPSAPKPRMNDTIRESLQRFRSGQSAEEIAHHRSLSIGTIHGHLASALELGEPGLSLDQLLTREQQQAIETAFAKAGYNGLGGAFQLLPAGYNYGQLRLFLAAKRAGARAD